PGTGTSCHVSRTGTPRPSPPVPARRSVSSSGDRRVSRSASVRRGRSRSTTSSVLMSRRYSAARHQAPGTYTQTHVRQEAEVTPRYAELHAHSAFSFLDGANQPEELAVEAHRLGLSALAVTDHDGLYGVVRFAEAARRIGLPAVIGAELTLGSAERATGQMDPPGTHLLALARGPQGYRSLSRAIAEAHLATGEKGRSDYRLPALAEAADGQWLVLTGCRKGAVRRAL